MKGKVLNDLKELYLEVVKGKGKPLDHWEVAALLEVYGIRDVDAKNEYGFENVFELARYLFDNYRNSVTYEEKRLVDQQEAPPLKERVIKNYLKGIAFALPMLLQIVFTLVFGFALWSSINLDATDATVIALGTFLALIVSGASAQIIGRKGLYYLKMNEKILSGKIMQVLLVQSLIKIIFLFIIILLANLLFDVFDSYLLYLFVSTFILLSVLFTVSSVYFVFEEYEKIFYFYLLGVVFVFIFHSLFGLEFPDAQFAALLCLDLIFIFFAWRRTTLLKRSQESEGEILPRTSMLVFTLLPFYLYGLLYFLFLVLDRLIAWNANSINRGFFVWFDVKYELGSDMGLIVIVLMMGLMEVLVYEFLYRLNEEVFNYKITEYEKFSAVLEKFFKKSLKLYTIYLFISIIVVFAMIFILKLVLSEKVFPFNGYAYFVFFMTSVAYGFLSFGLLNTLILFSFSRQSVVVKAIVYALLVDFFVGVVLANAFAIYFASLGLLVGSAVFWYITYKYMKRILQKLDYYYYSAF